MTRQGDAEPSGPTGTSNNLHIKQFHMSEGHLDISIMQGIERHRPSVTIARKSGSGCRPPNGLGLASHLLRCRPARAGLREKPSDPMLFGHGQPAPVVPQQSDQPDCLRRARGAIPAQVVEGHRRCSTYAICFDNEPKATDFANRSADRLTRHLALVARLQPQRVQAQDSGGEFAGFQGPRTGAGAEIGSDGRVNRPCGLIPAVRRLA
jgi:hypothetical protein